MVLEDRMWFLPKADPDRPSVAWWAMSIKVVWATANLPRAWMTSLRTSGLPSFAQESSSPATPRSSFMRSGLRMWSETSSLDSSSVFSSLIKAMRDPSAKTAAALTFGEAERRSLESLSVIPCWKARRESSNESSQILPRQRQSHCARSAVDPEMTLEGPCWREPRHTSTSLAWAQAFWPLGWLLQTPERMKAAPALDSGGIAESGISRKRIKYMKLESLVKSILQDWSRARIFVQMKTRICRSSFAVVWSSLRT
mmetsp:Transcript_8663/g.17563  ORF Transcript_8663/g.17563 Transcript_8663/m.17563 type:complete len:255 (-) Transcript_8663:197-961(-)